MEEKLNKKNRDFYEFRPDIIGMSYEELMEVHKSNNDEITIIISLLKSIVDLSRIIEEDWIPVEESEVKKIMGFMFRIVMEIECAVHKLKLDKNDIAI